VGLAGSDTRPTALELCQYPAGKDETDTRATSGIHTATALQNPSRHDDPLNPSRHGDPLNPSRHGDPLACVAGAVAACVVHAAALQVLLVT
jgi:hypothetical protein